MLDSNKLQLHLNILQYFAKSIYRHNTMEDILWDIASNVIIHLGFVDCVIYLLDVERKILIQKAAYGPKNINNASIADPLEINLGDGIVGTVALTGVSEIIDDCSVHPLYIKDDVARLSEICIPIIYDNKVIGVIDSEHPEKEFYNNYHVSILESIAAICSTKIASTLIADKNIVLARFFEESPMPMLRITGTGVLKNANLAATGLRNYWFGEGCDNLQSENVLQNIRNSLKHNRILKEQLKFGDRIYSIKLVPIKSRGYVNIYSSDITDMRKAQLEAEASTKAKDDFLSAMSHEIRTPLNAVLGITKLMKSTPLNKKQNYFQKILEFSGNQLLEIVNQILDLEKIIAGKIQFTYIAFDLKKTIEQITRTFMFQSKERGIDFQVKLCDKTPDMVIGDEVKLVQILSNILSNALKFTEKGQIVLEINSIALEKTSYTIQFKVTDNGIGIPEDKIEQIFKPFEQVNTQDFGGTGLGLTIVKDLVEKQGGSISIESKEGQGTTCNIKMNFSTSIKKVQDNELVKVDFKNSLEGYKVLVVDDNRINILVVKQFLSEWGMHVLKAEDGLKAIEQTELKKPDIILMDIHMPNCDGFEATKRIRKLNGGISSVPIIGMTADVTSSTKIKVLDSGMNDILTKPFNPPELMSLIKKMLHSKNLRYSRSKRLTNKVLNGS